MKPKIYIAGKITGDPDYKAKFEAAKRGARLNKQIKNLSRHCGCYGRQWAGPSHEVEVQDE